MRGLCSNSLFDRQYFYVTENKTTIFSGYYYSEIHKIEGDSTKSNDYGYWELKRHDKSKASARTKLLFPADYPTGRHKWTIVNDRCENMITELALTVCGKGQFSCTDGSCIPILKRCDLETNCPDGSDEDNCQPLILPEKYSETISPPRPTVAEPLPVFIYINIYSLRSFELISFKFVIDTVVTMVWKDERLKFRNLKHTTSLNNVEKALKMPWTPTFDLLGAGNTSSDVTERQYNLVARRDAAPLADDDQNVGEDEVFLGAENPLLLKRKVTVETACQYDLVNFPFDVQYCNIILLLTDTSENYVTLIQHKEGISYSGKRKLLEYYVSEVTMHNYSEGLYSGKRVSMVFENLVTFYITSSYIPTLIMLVIGCCSFFFPLSDFNDRVMVALTSLLVEAAFFTQVSSSIPKTAYLKLVDLWFVFCITCLFLVILGLTAVNMVYFRKTPIVFRVSPAWQSGQSGKPPPAIFGEGESTEELAEKLNRWLQIVFPALISLFVVIYVAVAMAAMKQQQISEY